MIVMPLLMTRLQAVTVSWDDAGMIVTSAVNEILRKISHDMSIVKTFADSSSPDVQAWRSETTCR